MATGTLAPAEQPDPIRKIYCGDYTIPPCRNEARAVQVTHFVAILSTIIRW